MKTKKCNLPVGRALCAEVHAALLAGEGVSQDTLDWFALVSIEQARQVARLMTVGEFARLLTDGLPQSITDRIKAGASDPAAIFPFDNPPALPPSSADLRELQTDEDVERFIVAHPGVFGMDEKQGKASNAGKLYRTYRTFDRVIGADGLQWSSASSKPVERLSLTPIKWNKGNLTQEQHILMLYDEHAQARGKRPDLSKHADALLARLMEAHPELREDDRVWKHRPERIWITMFRYLLAATRPRWQYVKTEYPDLDSLVKGTFGCRCEGLLSLASGDSQAYLCHIRPTAQRPALCGVADLNYTAIIPYDIVSCYEADTGQNMCPECQRLWRESWPPFAVGERVSWVTGSGETLTSTIRSVNHGLADIDTDQILAPGGVPLGRIEHVGVERLTRLGEGLPASGENSPGIEQESRCKLDTDNATNLVHVWSGPGAARWCGAEASEQAIEASQARVEDITCPVCKSKLAEFNEAVPIPRGLRPAKTMRAVITRLCAGHDIDLSQVGAHLRLEMPPYMPLVIEVIGPNQVAVAHYREENGDLIADPEIVFWVAPDDGEWFPIEVTQVPVAIRVSGETRVGGGWKRYVEFSDDGTRIEKVTNARMQADLASFVGMWAKNINPRTVAGVKAQGWLKNGIEVKRAGDLAATIAQDSPTLLNGHPRAPLPDGLREQVQAVHTLPESDQAAKDDAPFTKCVVLAPVVARLSELATVGHVLDLINQLPDAVQVVRTEGKGRQRGKQYVRFEIAAPVIGLDGKHCEPGAKSSVAFDDPASPLSWTAHWSNEQHILDLYEEHAVARQKYAEVARRADALFARLMQDNPAIQNDAAAPPREERIWLTMFRSIQGENSQPLIYSDPVSAALHKSFGCGWEGLSKISQEGCKVSTVEVVNLSTGETSTYTCSPRQAVIAAYAQDKKDWSTWMYQERYGHLVVESETCVSCGDWSALKTPGGDGAVPPPTVPELIAVHYKWFDKIRQSCSAQPIVEKGAVKAVWYIGQRYWVCTAVIVGSPSELTLCQVAPRAEWQGEVARTFNEQVRRLATYEGILVKCGRNEWVFTGQRCTAVVGEAPAVVDVEPAPKNVALAPRTEKADAPAKVPVSSNLDAPVEAPAKKDKASKLPDGIPQFIEMDMGRAAGWVRAMAIKVDTRFLYYCIGDKTGKVPLAGRGVTWRASAA